MNPRDFFVVAKKLSDINDPAHCRSAISRAYYAVYNQAVGILEQWGFEIERGPSGHKEVQYRLLYSNDKGAQVIRRQLMDLEGDRVKADYRLDQAAIEGQQTAQSKVLQVEKMMAELEAARTDGVRSGRMYDSIKKNEQRIQSMLREYRQRIAGDR